MKKKQFLIVCSIVAGILLFTGSSVHGVKTVKVGLVDCYTGPATLMACDVRDAFKLVAEEINDRGGIRGRKIECIIKDTKSRVDIGTRAAEDLIREEKVDFLMGAVNSEVALAISEVAKKERVPFFSTLCKSEKITGERGHRYVFGITENRAMAGKAAALGLSQKSYKRYWIAGDDLECGRSVAEDIWYRLSELRPDVRKIGESWWKADNRELVPYLETIRKANPDAVIFAMGGLNMVNFLKAVKVSRIHETVPIFVHTATELSFLLSLGLEAPQGVMGTSNYHFYYPNEPENRTFLETFMKRYGRYPKVGALYGYLTARFIEKACMTAEGIDRESLVNSLEDLTVDSPVGPVRIRACDHQAVLPMFMGVTRRSPEYPFLVAGDMSMIPGEDTMPTCEEILKARCLQ